jgi:hypothetical protein
MPGSTLRYFPSLTFRWIMVESETLIGHWMKKIWLFSFWWCWPNQPRMCSFWRSLFFSSHP